MSYIRSKHLYITFANFSVSVRSLPRSSPHITHLINEFRIKIELLIPRPLGSGLI